MKKELRELIKYNCDALQKSSGTYREIFEVMFRLEDSVMYETNDGYRVSKVTFREAKEEIKLMADAIYSQIGATKEFVALEMDNCPE